MKLIAENYLSWWRLNIKSSVLQILVNLLSLVDLTMAILALFEQSNSKQVVRQRQNGYMDISRKWLNGGGGAVTQLVLMMAILASLLKT